MYTLDEQGNKLKVERYKKASNDVKVVRSADSDKADSDKDDKFLSNSMLTILLVLLMYYMYLLII